MNEAYYWPWHDQDYGFIDAGRMKRAEGVKFERMTATDHECSAIAIGSNGERYYTTLQSCTCRDFTIQHGKMPCKHIIHLATENEIINSAGNDEDQQRYADRDFYKGLVAKAYGYYYLHKEPIMSDKEYDELKRKYIESENLI